MKVLIAGDFCPLNRVAAAFDKEDYASVLSEVREIVPTADYAIVNFECPVVSKGTNPIEKHGPNLRCTPNGIKAVKWMEFDCVTLANNHFLDYGEEGVKETLATLNEQGIDYVGGGINLADASRVLYKDIAGQKLAIINCCEHEFSIASEKTAGSNPLNPIQQYNSIIEARKNADKVLVIVHGGHELYQLPSPRMVETYRFFVDAGADAVVNHHQHCYSGYEIYKEKPIFYGLGNFCFDKQGKRNSEWNEGYMVLVDMNNPVAFDIIPYSQCSDDANVHILQRDVYDDCIKQLNSIIVDKEKLGVETRKYYNQQDRYFNFIEPIRNRFYLSAKLRGWLPSLISKKRKIEAKDYIECESHRDILIWKLNNK